MRNSLQQLQQLGVAVVGHAALLGEVVVVGRDELAHGHDAGRLVLQHVDDLPAELDELRVPHRTLAALDPRLCRSRTVSVWAEKESRRVFVMGDGGASLRLTSLPEFGP